MVFFGQGPHGAGDQFEAATGDGQFAGLGAEQVAGNAHNVAHVQLLDDLVSLFVQMLARGIALDAAALVHEVEEGHLAEGAQRDDAPGNGKDVFLFFQVVAFQAAELFQHPGNGMVFVEIIGKKGHARVQQVTGFADPVFDDLVEIIARGETFQHGHEVCRMRRLGAQFDNRLFLLFPVFH